MTSRFLLSTIPLASALALAACGGGSNDNGPNNNLPTLSAGSYTLLANGDSVGFGEAFYGASGNGFVLLAASDRQPATVLYQTTNGVTTRVPASASNVSLTYSTRSIGGFSAIATAAVAGTYSTQVGSDSASLTLDANGKLTAGNSNCKISGQITPAAAYAEAVEVQVGFSGCASASGNFSGLAFSRTDYGRGVVRLVVHNGSSIIDLLLFKS